MYDTLYKEDQTEWTKEETLDHINTNRFFAAFNLNRISGLIGPEIYIYPPLPKGIVGLLLYTTSKEELDETSKEETIETSDKDETQVDPNGNQDKPTNQTKSSERQNKVFAKTPIGPCLTPQILKTTTTTKSKINLIQYTALNPCTSSSSNCSDKTSKEKLNKMSKEETLVDISRNQQVDSSGNQQVDSSGNRQVDSGGNQDQATDQKELNPQDNDAIGPQASKDNPLPSLPTLAQLPEPQSNITTAPSVQAPSV